MASNGITQPCRFEWIAVLAQHISMGYGERHHHRSIITVHVGNDVFITLSPSLRTISTIVIGLQCARSLNSAIEHPMIYRANQFESRG